MDSCKESTQIDCSVVVPLYNESQVVDELHSRLRKVMDSTGLVYELIFVDDGSSDSTPSRLEEIVRRDPYLTVVELRRNFGQTAALAAGFDIAAGRMIISMDGDLQHLPEEIPLFLEALEEGYDVVSGWRKQRVDNLLMRKIPSRAANWLAAQISGVAIHDFGTTFKAFRREILSELNLYGEMHRFIPALLSCSGAKITEIPIANVVRPKGKSNYGISRTFRVAFDLITLRFLLGYLTKPLHFFGRMAFYSIITSVLILIYILFDKFYYKVPIMVAHAPLAGVAGVLLIFSLIFISTGLLAEMLSRVYFESTHKKIYSVKSCHRQVGLTEEKK